VSRDLHTDLLFGLDLGRLRRWFASSVPEYTGAALSATVLAGGKSNLTCRVTDEEHAGVVRRPLLGPVLPRARCARAVPFLYQLSPLIQRQKPTG
jgi:aminoglycoside phosphotransferase (APT) family kinase protein